MAISFATSAELLPAHRLYRPRGAALQLMLDRSPEILLSGPAGTGKSRACLEKLHLMAERYPGLRALIVRRTRASLTESALVTFEEHVVPEGHPCLDGSRRLNRHSYRYSNNSEIVCGGMDKPGKVMSSEWDVIYVQEATEMTEDGWEALTMRLRNVTASTLGYKQVIADCNPDRPTHWLKVRCDASRCKMLESRHEDNPLYWDVKTKAWTPEGITYIARLDTLTGPRRLRYRFGRWVRSEGIVYCEWDPAIHIIDRFKVPASWPRLWTIDFGFTNPFSWSHWALDGDGRLYCVQQIYHTRRLVVDHARRIREITRDQPAPLAIICDTEDAEGRATLEAELGMVTMGAIKAGRAKHLGIQAVQRRLRTQPDGLPRLFMLRDSLDEMDSELAESKKPWCGEHEWDSYIWNPDRAEEPVDKDNHFLDALRYLTFALDAPTAAEDPRQTVLRS